MIIFDVQSNILVAKLGDNLNATTTDARVTRDGIRLAYGGGFRDLRRSSNNGRRFISVDIIVKSVNDNYNTHTQLHVKIIISIIIENCGNHCLQSNWHLNIWVEKGDNKSIKPEHNIF